MIAFSYWHEFVHYDNVKLDAFFYFFHNVGTIEAVPLAFFTLLLPLRFAEFRCRELPSIPCLPAELPVKVFTGGIIQ